jgi:hypothetical protein
VAEPMTPSERSEVLEWAREILATRGHGFERLARLAIEQAAELERLREYGLTPEPYIQRARVAEAAAQEMAEALKQLIARINPEPGRGVCVMDNDPPLPLARAALATYAKASRSPEGR